MGKPTQLRIYQDSRSFGTCRSCGAKIEWAELVASGKRMPFNPPILPVLTEGHLLQGERTVEVVDTGITPVHFQTCPDATTWRRK